MPPTVPKSPLTEQEIKQWAKGCIQCKTVKVNRHVISDLEVFQKVGRFEHIHVDIVDLLTTS